MTSRVAPRLRVAVRTTTGWSVERPRGVKRWLRDAVDAASR